MTDSPFTGFARATRAEPERPCVEDADGVVTRAELMREISGLAAQLTRTGAAGRVVGVFLPRDRHLPAAILAAHAAGAAYLPLDPAQPDARLHVMLSDATPVQVLTSSALRHRLPDGYPVLVHEQAWPESEPSIGFGQAADRPSDVADGLAYLMYTSGSSGVPKGVAVGHAALANFFATLDTMLATPEEQVWQVMSSVGFDSSVAELLWPLSRGKYVCITPNDPLSLLDSAVARGTALGARVTHVQGTPSMARLLASDLATLDGLRRLEVLMVGGEPFPTDVLAELNADGASATTMINVYGPTEATVWVACAPITTHSPLPCPIGPPIPGARLYVLDEQERPAHSGHLYIGGVPLAFGYWRRPALTATRFVPDPFTQDGRRMYHTGDRAMVRPDGQIVLLGRADDQVKIGGHRVELGEIEHMLKSCPWVSDAVCLLDTDTDVEQWAKLTAVVVADASRPDSELRTWLAGRLPSYMLPNRFVRRDRLPMTVSGKVDRLSLHRWLTGQAGHDRA